MPDYLAICGWERHQRYKAKHPSYVLLFTDLNDEYQADGSPGKVRPLSDRAFRLIIGLWATVRPRYERIPADPEWLGKMIGMVVSHYEIDELSAAGLVEICRDAANRCKSLQSTASPDKHLLSDSDSDSDSETDSDTETERPKADGGFRVVYPSEEHIQAVYQHYLKVMGKTESTYRLLKSRKARIITRLKEWEPADGVKALCTAIDKCAASEFHMGVNDRGKLYNDLEDHILSSEKRMEKWLYGDVGRRANG